ncbi:hypothetical protein KC644_01375 [Candidatus Berkelbacteria bacterium]|nr:hypothetical protein [Candidatus Berkelbacteria bacterium]
MTAIPLEPEDVCGMHPQDRDLLATASLNEIQNLFAKYLKIKRSQIFDFASRVAQVVRDICGYEDAIFVPFEHFDPDKNPDITPVEIRKVEEGVVSRCGCLLVFLDYASNGVGIETA